MSRSEAASVAVTPRPRQSYHVVLNAAAGSASAPAISPEIIEAGLRQAGAASVTVDADRSRPLDARIQAAIEGGAAVIVAAGGDGTVTAVASAIAGTDLVLAILPLGTANLLARDLKIPLDLDAAMAAVTGMALRRIDVGAVNGRVFLHKVVIGLAPEIAAGRERIRHRSDLAAIVGFLGYFRRQVSRPRDLQLVLTADGKPEETRRVRAIAVANNGYDEGLGLLFSRSTLDGGYLTIYTLERLRLGDVLRLSLAMLLGRWRRDAALTERRVTSAVLRTRRRLVQAMVDGEVEKLRSPLHFDIQPGALLILAPVIPGAPAEPGERS